MATKKTKKKQKTTVKPKKKVAHKKAAPKKATPKKTAAKKTVAKKAAHKKITPKKVAHKKAAPKKLVPKKIAKKVLPKKVEAKKQAAPVKTKAKAQPIVQKVKKCKKSLCKEPASINGYCRYHYIAGWRTENIDKKVKKLNHLEKTINEIKKRFTPEYLELIKADLATDENFRKVIKDMDLEEDINDFEISDDTQKIIDKSCCRSGGPAMWRSSPYLARTHRRWRTTHRWRTTRRSRPARTGIPVRPAPVGWRR